MFILLASHYSQIGRLSIIQQSNNKLLRTFSTETKSKTIRKFLLEEDYPAAVIVLFFFCCCCCCLFCFVLLCFVLFLSHWMYSHSYCVMCNTQKNKYIQTSQLFMSQKSLKQYFFLNFLLMTPLKLFINIQQVSTNNEV